MNCYTISQFQQGFHFVKKLGVQDASSKLFGSCAISEIGYHDA